MEHDQNQQAQAVVDAEMKSNDEEGGETQQHDNHNSDTVVESSLPQLQDNVEVRREECEQVQPRQLEHDFSMSSDNPNVPNPQDTTTTCYHGNTESVNNSSSSSITHPVSNGDEATECQNPGQVASDPMDVETDYPDPENSSSIQDSHITPGDENISPDHQQPVQSFIGPQIPVQSCIGPQIPGQSFNGPQIPGQYTPQHEYEQSIDQSSFIGPQIPENYAGSRTEHEAVYQEPFDSKFSFSSTVSMPCVAKASTMFMKDDQENYLRGCKWSPDGTQVLTNSNDNILRTFTPMHQESRDNPDSCPKEMDPCCVIKESGIVYDYSWLPGMVNSQPETCRVACCCPGSPIHLWNPQDSQLVSSYRAFDHCDEVTSAYSVSFSPDGSKIYGGYKNSIRVFDTEYCHHKCSMIKTLNPKTKEGHTGIVSCFSHGAPGSNTFVTGSYSRHVGIYYSLTNELVCLIQGQQGGVTHIMISPDGTRLYTGGRKDPEIVCWDMRNMGQVLCTFLRDVQTNQRVYFDLSQSGRYLVSGNHDGSVQMWDTLQGGHEVAGEIIMKPCAAFQAHGDCTNGVSFNHHRPMLATTSGQRHFKDFDMESDSDNSGDEESGKKMKVEKREAPDFSLKIWDIPCLAS